jgi:hypothetical protein
MWGFASHPSMIVAFSTLKHTGPSAPAQCHCGLYFFDAQSNALPTLIDISRGLPQKTPTFQYAAACLCTSSREPTISSGGSPGLFWSSAIFTFVEVGIGQGQKIHYGSRDVNSFSCLAEVLGLHFFLTLSKVCLLCVMTASTIDWSFSSRRSSCGE